MYLFGSYPSWKCGRKSSYINSKHKYQLVPTAFASIFTCTHCNASQGCIHIAFSFTVVLMVNIRSLSSASEKKVLTKKSSVIFVHFIHSSGYHSVHHLVVSSKLYSFLASSCNIWRNSAWWFRRSDVVHTYNDEKKYIFKFQNC